VKSKYTHLFAFAVLATVICVGGHSSSTQADSTAHFELYNAPVTPPDAADAAEQDRQINELYSHYVDCLDTVGREEFCYRSWWRECKAIYQGKCPVLEEKMFPTSAAGDESC